MKQFAGTLVVVVLVFSAAISGKAQAKPTLPTTYTLTEMVGIFGDPFPLQVARKGQFAYMKHWKQGTNVVSSLTVIDIAKGQTVTWDPNVKPIECSTGNFKGSWGDPFEDNASLMDDMKKLNGKQVGTEQFLGMTVNVWEAVAPDPTGKVKAWVDAKSGAVLKIATYPPTGKAQVLSEITQLSYAAPADALFKVPAECTAAANAPKPPGDDDKIRALTNDDPGNYVRAIMSPDSKDSCSIIYKVVQAGTMQPIAPTFTVSVDIGNVDGPRHKLTGVNGVYKIANIPPHFNLETEFGDGGGAFALIHRQCFGPQTVLLYVIKNPAKITDGGDYYWVKSGKYAAGAKK